MKKTAWRDGNRIELLENGEEFFPRVLEAIAAARHSIYIETFILADDCVGKDLNAALCKARERGVEVDVLADGFGSDPLSDDYVESLRNAGVRLLLFEPQPRLFGFRTNLLRRQHRKIVVIDGRLAYIGGINFCSDHLIESGPRALQDFAVEIEGPLVQDIAEAGAELLGDLRRPRRWWQRRRRVTQSARQPEAGGSRGRLVVRDNGRRRTAIEREYRLAIRMAKEEIIIANAYFFPGFRLLRDIRNAARRGVRVVLMVQGNPDMPIVTIVARWLYHYLIPAGVEIVEYCERPLHGKVAVVDRRWSTVGSSNLDPLSLALNLEANVVIDDPAFAAQLRERLQDLIENSCTRVDPDSVPRRTLWRMLLGVIVFHFLRRFPRWAAQLPAHRPRIVAPGAGDADTVAGTGDTRSRPEAPPNDRETADPSNDSQHAAPARAATSDPAGVARRDPAADDDRQNPQGGWQRARQLFWLAFSVLVIGLIGRLAWNTEWTEVGAAIAQREWTTLALIAAAAGLSHLVFGLYDVISRYVVAPRLPAWRAWATAISCYALNLNLGALVGGVGLRYRLYRKQQVESAAATRIITLGIVANWVGYVLVVTALLPWAGHFGWSHWLGEGQAWAACAVGVIALVAYAALCARGVGFSLRGHRFEPLPLRFAAPQALLSAANWAWLGFVMSLCLGPEVSYAESLGVLLASAVVGAMAHVPGGWGVIEVVVVTLLADRLPQSQLIASVLVYRGANYLLPLPAALLGYFALGRGQAGSAEDAAHAPHRVAGSRRAQRARRERREEQPLARQGSAA